MKHCNTDIGVLDIWYLQDIEGFTNRTLEISKCHICKKKIILLSETRIVDNEVFVNQFSGDKAKKVANRERKRIVYTLREAPIYSDDWVFGVNKEIKNKQGKVTQTRQYACGYKNHKTALIKTTKVK